MSLFSTLFLVGCVHSSSTLERYDFQQPQMGLPFRIVCYAKTPQIATNAANTAFLRISELNQSLSDYEENSELSQLSRTAGSGQEVPLSHDLWTVLNCAQRISAETGGAFDVTVGPQIQLWRRARRQRQLPSADALFKANQSVGWKYLVLGRVHTPIQAHTHESGFFARLELSGMRLDLGGIAKGYALDEAQNVLRRQGVRRALVSGGGDMVASQPPPHQPGWKITVGALDSTNAPPPRTVWLANRSLCTSGDVFQHVEIDGIRYSHIVDPHSGIGLTDHSLVTLIGKTGMETDALSTAVSVLGPTQGITFLSQKYSPSVQGLITRQVGGRIEQVKTPDWHQFEPVPPLP